jgi:hypothetical protein
MNQVREVQTKDAAGLKQWIHNNNTYINNLPRWLNYEHQTTRGENNQADLNADAERKGRRLEYRRLAIDNRICHQKTERTDVQRSPEKYNAFYCSSVRGQSCGNTVIVRITVKVGCSLQLCQHRDSSPDVWFTQIK